MVSCWYNKGELKVRTSSICSKWSDAITSTLCLCWNSRQLRSTLISRCCMELIGKPVDPNTLHAVLNICVRFTRQYHNARLVAEEGVVEKLLKLTDASNFCGIFGLSTMLIRHILEEPANITAAIEKVTTMYLTYFCHFNCTPLFINERVIHHVTLPL